MASVQSVIQRLEGLLGSIGNVDNGLTPATSAGMTTNWGQDTQTWLEEMKGIMRMPANRDLTDWELASFGNVVNASSTAVVSASACTLYGFLVGSIENGNAEYVVAYNHANKTLDFTAALDTTSMAVLHLPAAASASFREYAEAAFPKGIACATALSFSADGSDGTAPTANDITLFVLYRTA